MLIIYLIKPVYLKCYISVWNNIKLLNIFHFFVVSLCVYFTVTENLNSY